MTKKQKIILGILLIITGSAGVIVSSFSLKNDAAWLSVGCISLIMAIYGIRLIDSRHI